MFVPRYYQSQSPKKNIYSRQNSKRMSMTLARITKRLDDGQHIGLAKSNNFTRTHGCGMCPYWGTSRCYHKVVPPTTHSNGICEDRVKEIIEYVRMGHTFSAKEAKRNEVVHKVANHIIVLEANLIDYRLKRREEIISRIAADKGIDLSKEDNNNIILSYFSKEDIALSSYEKEVMNQIEKLSDNYVKYMAEDMTLEVKAAKEGGDKKGVITPMQLGALMRQANKHLVDVTPNKKRLSAKNPSEEERGEGV